MKTNTTQNILNFVNTTKKKIKDKYISNIVFGEHFHFCEFYVLHFTVKLIQKKKKN